MPNETPIATAASGTVNGPAVIPLYRDGREIAVPESDVEHWLGEGWLRDPIQPAAAVGELRTMATAMVQAFEVLVSEASEAEDLDTRDGSALHVAQRAYEEVAQACANVLQAIQTATPVRQAAGQWMHRGSGDEHEEIRVDPGQMELYEGQGWTKGRN